MAIKTYNVLYFNGHFYQKENKRRLIPNPSSEFAIVAQPADFLEQDIFNTPPPVLSPEAKKAALLKEKDLEKYVLLLPEGSKLYFRLGISKTDRKEEKWQYEFEIRLLEDLYLYRKTTSKQETKASCYHCACEMTSELTGGLPVPPEQVFGTSLNDIFENVTQLYFAGKRSSAINVFNEFYTAPGQRAFSLGRLRDLARFEEV